MKLSRLGAVSVGLLVGSTLAGGLHYCRQAPYNWFNFYDFWAQRPLA